MIGADTKRMSVRDRMVSHVVEYHCQYTDQLRKKHKAWHDGKLKYFQLNNKFQLYTLEDNVLLSSEFITNLKQLDNILDESKFGSEEHQVFSQYLVVISEIDCEYDRELNGFNHNAVTTKKSVQPATVASSGCMRSNTANLTSTRSEPTGKLRVKRVEKSATNTRSSLALRFNKPFKPPKMLKKDLNSENAMDKPAVKPVEGIDQDPVVKNSLALDMNSPKTKVSSVIRYRVARSTPSTQTGILLAENQCTELNKTARSMPSTQFGAFLDTTGRSDESVSAGICSELHISRKPDCNPGAADDYDHDDKDLGKYGVLNNRSQPRSNFPVYKNTGLRIGRGKRIIDHEPITLSRGFSDLS